MKRGGLWRLTPNFSTESVEELMTHKQRNKRQSEWGRGGENAGREQ